MSQTIPTSMMSPLASAAIAAPELIAFYQWQTTGYQGISYQQLQQRVAACADQLKQAGANQGTRIACIDNNSLALVILYWACIDIGAVFCPLSPRFPKAQIAQLAQDYGFNLFWASASFQHLLPSASLEIKFSAIADRPTTACDTQRACNLILTSGSSGQPKAAQHNLANHIANAKGSSQLISIQQEDNWLLSLPLFHIGGLAIVNRCALAKAAMTLPAPEYSLAEQLQALPLTHLSLVATQLARVLEQDPNSLIGIKALLLGGGDIASSLLAQLRHLGIKAYTSYGMTEMGSQITTGLASDKGSSGKLLPYRQLKIIDRQIYVKGDTLFMGYLSADGGQSLNSMRDDDGWFATKDLGDWDDEGDLIILGRADNMFICGGENIQPEEVEAALKRHPDIHDAIVFPIEDQEFGYLPAAIINGTISDQQQLDQFVCQYIARFKRPRYYYPWPEVQSTSLKVARQQVIAAVLNPY
ncbi:o-succinylbenzoate--CoA ligase [Shewanella sp. Isolate11]|uniref:o-succinylbenzoate--CoA ligase n=1 Tax=Shewanella sp. Isolate11 TaxID=2908530 RepID=UPI001EFD41D0|nr:o-succinylbenzoate--CoA ligase [Shewanella sp. Isolate11]MCG9697894.1 o-succinylbenzoate--CoA ligase [Shewanella sp. Isolate11]